MLPLDAWQLQKEHMGLTHISVEKNIPLSKINQGYNNIIK